eukprot:403334795
MIAEISVAQLAVSSGLAYSGASNSDKQLQIIIPVVITVVFLLLILTLVLVIKFCYKITFCQALTIVVCFRYTRGVNSFKELRSREQKARRDRQRQKQIKIKPDNYDKKKRENKKKKEKLAEINHQHKHQQLQQNSRIENSYNKDSPRDSKMKRGNKLNRDQQKDNNDDYQQEFQNTIQLSQHHLNPNMNLLSNTHIDNQNTNEDNSNNFDTIRFGLQQMDDILRIQTMSLGLNIVPSFNLQVNPYLRNTQLDKLVGITPEQRKEFIPRVGKTEEKEVPDTTTKDKENSQNSSRNYTKQFRIKESDLENGSIGNSNNKPDLKPVNSNVVKLPELQLTKKNLYDFNVFDNSPKNY